MYMYISIYKYIIYRPRAVFNICNTDGALVYSFCSASTDGFGDSVVAKVDVCQSSGGNIQ